MIARAQTHASTFSARGPLRSAERESLLRDGTAWADAAGVWHEGAPDADIIAAAITAHAGDPYVQRALREANDAALEVGRLWQLLDAAEKAASIAHRQVHIKVIACMSRANLAPHDAAHDAYLRDYFADLADSC